MVKLFSFRWQLSLFVFFACGLLVGIAHADIKRIPGNPPKSFNELEGVLDDLENNVNEAQCGGWNMEESVEPYISAVNGVPGRKGIWNGNIQSGLAKRDEESGLLEDGFTFPSTSNAIGWSTACRSGDLAGFFRAAELDNCKTPGNCQSFCVDLNKWQYDMAAPTKKCVYNATPPKSGIWGYCCTDQRVTEREYEIKMDSRHADAARNCIQCQGDGAAFEGETEDFNGERLDRMTRNETGCRWGKTVNEASDNPLLGDIPANTTELPEPNTMVFFGTGLENARRYVSFFRRYTGQYSRDNLSEAPRDNESGGVNVQCYGMYEEKDPKTTKTNLDDKNCVISTNFSARAETQLGKGEFKDNPDVENLPLMKRPYEEGTDIWFPHIGDAISLIDGKELKEKYKSDITFPLLAVDSAGQKATVQISEDQPLSDGNLIRAFDDTVATYENPQGEKQNPERRTVVQWWQGMETQAHTLFTPSVVHLSLPSPWGMALDPLDPFLVPGTEPEVVQKDPQAQSIEMQLQLKEDLLGEIIAYLRRSYLLKMQEEKIAVAVPMGSPTEFRAIADGWCKWYIETENKKKTGDEEPLKDCAGAPQEVKELMSRLEEYAVRIDEVRTLRAELALTMGILLERQKELTQTLADWLKANTEQYAQLANSHAERMALQKDFRKLQDVYRSLHDDEALGWCRNDRFTTPIYSLNDPALPGRPDLTAGIFNPPPAAQLPLDPDRLPQFTVERSKDLILDFSGFYAPQTALKMPVLDVIQIRIDASLISLPVNDTPKVPKLPPLPEVPSLVNGDLLNDVFPEVEPSDTPAKTIQSFIPPPANMNLEYIKAVFAKSNEFLTAMKKSYTDFVNGVMYDKTGLTTICQTKGMLPCVYHENELKQILGRLTARPLVFLKEDFESIGERRNPAVDEGGYDSCPPEDHTCQRLNRSETYPREGWSITGLSSNDEAIEKLHVEMMKMTLGKEEDERFPFAVGDLDILPSYNVSETFILSPPLNEEE